MERRRHIRKYARRAAPERSFYFRAARQAQAPRPKPSLFLQLADGVDDDTWTFHRERGADSGWFRYSSKDEGLAEEAVSIEKDRTLSPVDARKKLRELIERTYTIPAAGPLPIPGTAAEPKHATDGKAPIQRKT